jgi:hypothetical protein
VYVLLNINDREHHEAPFLTSSLITPFL